MCGWGWLILAPPALAAAGSTVRELLAFYRARRWAQVAEQFVRSARPGPDIRIRLEPGGGFDLSIGHLPADPPADDVPVPGDAA